MEDNSRNRTAAVYKAVLRAAVAGYLIYLGVSMIIDHLNGTSALASWIVWTAGPVFAAAGAVFGWVTWKRYRAETEEEPAEPEDDEEQTEKN